MTYSIEMNQITKVYGNTVANDHIDLAVKDGHIHAVLGENGAGKTTLMKILFGEEKPTEGSIKVFGEPVTISNPAMALKLSIGLIHQHFTLVNEFTIAQNFALGIEPTTAMLFSDYRKVNEKVKEIIKMLDVPMNLSAPVGSFSVEEQQIIEIGKALYRGAKILILDEPTSVLTPQRIEKLLEILKVLKKEGKTIILITHKLEEALAIADEISILRRGKLVATLPRGQVDRSELIRYMVGDEPLINIEREEQPFKEPKVQLRNISVKTRSHKGVHNISLDIHKGEIFGLTGVGGNGQDELVEALVGLRPINEGEILFDGEDITAWGIKKRRMNGFAYVAEDRVKRGSAVALPIYDNVVMSHHYWSDYRHGLMMNQKKLRKFSDDIIEKYNVVSDSIDINAGSLSGGNLQKVIIGREFSFGATFMIVAYPSQGIDIRTTKFVHSEMLRLRQEGVAILLVSGDLDEIYSLSDRIGVMFSGNLVAVTTPAETNRIELGQYMTGALRN